MKKFLALLCLVMAMLLGVGCAPTTMGGDVRATVETTETQVAIVVEEVDGDVRLIDVMTALQEEGKLTFTVDAQGLVKSINGKETAADWSKYWALYISDAELSDMTYGIEWNGQQLGFSNFGAEALLVETGGAYVWQYFGA